MLSGVLAAPARWPAEAGGGGTGVILQRHAVLGETPGAWRLATQAAVIAGE